MLPVDKVTLGAVVVDVLGLVPETA